MTTTLVLAVLASTAAPDRVVVFPDRAQVTRATQVACGARVPITFEGIPPAAAQDSFRARLTGGTVDGLRAELVTQEKLFSPKAEALTKQLEALQLERQALNDDLLRARTQQSAGQRYGDLATQLVSRDMVERADPKSWQAAFEASLAAGLSSAKTQAELGAKLKDVTRREEEVRLQLEQVQVSARKQAWTVEVLASCPAGKSATLELVYLVGGASWAPVYDARAVESARAVDFSTWATLTQATGEDWSQVELVLSTAVPSQNATPPELMKLKVTAYEKAPEKKVLVRRDEYVERAQTGKDTGGAEADQPLAVRSQGLSVQLEVPEKAKVPGDGSPVRLFVGKTRMKASFELRAMPRLYPVAFRVAELTNQAPWPLLPGRVDAFRATGLVGRYQLERVAQGAAFTLTFGLEDSVRLKRTTMEELKRDAGLFNDKKRFTYAYRFEVANYGKAPVEVALSESLPVSELDDIVVAVTEKTTAGYALGKDDGIAKWKVPLRPGEKKNVDLAYKVEVPSSYDTGGL